MSVASSNTSEDDYLLRRVNNLDESELRSVLQHISLVHPEVVGAALKHVKQLYADDAHSVMTDKMSNTIHEEEVMPPPAAIAHPSKRGCAEVVLPLRPSPDGTVVLPPRPGGAVSKRGGVDVDDDAPRPRVVPGDRPSSMPPPQVPHRRRAMSPEGSQQPQRRAPQPPPSISPASIRIRRAVPQPSMPPPLL